ncbi:PilZ domain-containing protein [Pseudoalteromonas obscura]|uniref:PilZ domain-containing protein n=1 Tax=Pseudoalteromonas obscura TaxID=3048491 RepID=A0ABT7ELB3_9GAMM|nr:PilZ domain-containing protein [Pseudoalteromonas sp. P94(2023)]MDK2595841.1 PilZ domain-containing protein [Pseudoalteromonas sp. P94(2023)]
MSEDKLELHQDLINDLKGDLGDPNFDFIFKQKTAQLSKPDQFLLKMEMTRLSQPVARFIDLRGQVSGDVKPYEHDGKQHFMDDLAISVFEREVAQHGGYTMAVYEAVMHTDNNYKVMQKQAQVQDDTEPEVVFEHEAQLIRFASYESRIEERMNYSIKITVELKSGTTIPASTSDISLSGAKIKLGKSYHVHPKNVITLRLVGLEQDFELGLKEGIQYEVVAVEESNSDYNYVRLKRTFVENNSGFDEFLESFIHGNKRRYKINLDNTMDAVVCKGYEQYYLPRVSSLFVFFSRINNMLLPSMTLTNENNAFINYYFEDERKTSCLYSIFNNKRLQKLLLQSAPVKEAYCYTFTHSNGGKIYFYSAFDYELEENPELKSLFLGFGSEKESWRVFKVQLMPSHHEDAYIPLSLPKSAGKNVEKLNRRPPPRAQGLIEPVHHLMLLTEITTPEHKSHCSKLTYPQESINRLKEFGHGKSKNPPPLEKVALEYVNLRSHKRFLYRTGVALNISDSQVFSGNTRDFSIMGLQIEVEHAVDVAKGDLVTVDLPDLQKITKQHVLSGLRYEVMAVSKSKTIINLKVKQVTNASHTAIEFFTALIDNNKDKLQPSEEAPKIPGLSTALRNMVTKSICQLPLYLHKKASHMEIGAVGHGLYPSPLHNILLPHLINHNGQELLFPNKLFPNKFIGDSLTEQLKEKSRQDKPLRFTLFVHYDEKQSDESNHGVKSQCIPFGEPIEPLFLFAKKALKNGILFICHLYVSKTGRPDMDHLANELRYVSHYALHKAKGLEEALWSVNGVCDVVDVTDVMMPVLGLENHLIERMKNRKREWLTKHF